VSASSSNSSVASATAASNTLPGTYSIEVDNIGSSTSAISGAATPPVTDPTSGNISSSLNYTLTVNGKPQTITLTSNTLDSLAKAVNDSGAGVSATIVNLGSNSSPDYRLAVTSNELGADTIQLNDGTNDLLTALQTGADAQYKVNGSSATLTSNSDQVTLAPGLTATLRSASSGNNVNITVTASESALSSALSNFATAYNAAVAAVANERGQSGGALAGESLVYTLGNTLSQITQFVNGSGSVRDLSDLGLNLDSTGNLSFDASQFNSQGAAGIQQFLGGITSGGFLQTANNALSTVADPASGALAGEITSVKGEITNDQNQISDDQTRVNNIQTSLQAQLSAADAAIAVLQQQSTYYTNLFQTENANHMAGMA
jgi:flagellar hook-associated protein 2